MARGRQLRLPMTPRRQKIWSYESANVSVGELLTIGGKQVVQNLLSSLKSDMGITRPPPGITAMRIIGSIHPGNASTATTNVVNALAWGIGWVRSNVANLPVNDNGIPDPLAQGVREHEWIQTGWLLYRTNNGTQLPASVTGRMLDQGSMQLDISQMRKQPTADHELVLIVHHVGATGSDPAVWYSLNTMLALP